MLSPTLSFTKLALRGACFATTIIFTACAAIYGFGYMQGQMDVKDIENFAAVNIKPLTDPSAIALEQEKLAEDRRIYHDTHAAICASGRLPKYAGGSEVSKAAQVRHCGKAKAAQGRVPIVEPLNFD